MENITLKDLKHLQKSIKNAPKAKKVEIMKILDLYIPLMEAQIKEVSKELKV